MPLAFSGIKAFSSHRGQLRNQLCPVNEIILSLLFLIFLPNMDCDTAFLRDLWHYGLPSNSLKPGKMVAKTFLNEPILFGRRLSGEVFAIQNRCPHRSIPLDRGRFDGHEVSCGYHGWRFDSTGRCTAIPSLIDSSTAVLDKICVRSYPTQEKDGNIWIFMGSNSTSKPSFNVPEVWGVDNRSFQLLTQMNFDCSIDPAAVLLIDPAHIPFVHTAWWWGEKSELTEEVKTFDPNPYGFTMRRHKLLEANFFYRLLGGIPEVEIEFYLPGIRIERITTAKHTVCNVTAVTPITETQTEVTNLLYTTLSWMPLLKPVFALLAHQFLDQDRTIVAQPDRASRSFPDSPEIFVKDADTPVRWYYQLKREFRRSQQEDRPFTNPVKTQTLRWYS